MKTLGQALKKLLQDLEIENQVHQYQAVTLWPRIVGDKIASVTRAEKVEHQVLFIRVSNDSWRNELFYMKKDIIEKLNAKLGQKIIKDIRLY
ncbi:MAG: DUF721 domain-containing protein [candidate division KSB1 bacterium]|nr:DUF721 domain-containing protein [candidate division KSB1 bacterium]MDZ7340953.1 DUF721 domain-containing protein [candidate division KSB1 bacterium]